MGTVHQDAEICASLLKEREQIKHPLLAGRKGWVQVARGAVEVNGRALHADDAVAAQGEPELVLGSTSNGTEIILFDLK
jgi:redox-sensitive bicupin YhaK (pirin superfamily)